MKKVIFLLLGILVVGMVVHWKRVSDQEALMAKERAAWAQAKGELEAALQKKATAPLPPPIIIKEKELVQVPALADPREIIARLKEIKISSAGPQTKNSRIAIQHFENLIACGTNALPPIREFLLLNQEVDYDSWISPRASRDGRVSTSFVLPPSLRFGLFDVSRHIGGEEAELLLSEILEMTGRGAELAYLARVLQEIAPDKYREMALNNARELLANPLTGTSSGLDRYDREYLYGVLSFFGDASFAGEAQAQLARADGSVDRGALRYLQQTLGEQALPFIAQKYDDPALNSSGKERLGRFALNFAGLNPQADALWRHAILDKTLPLSERNELIEDLNQDGFESTKNPTARDLVLITNRLALIERHRGEADHRRITDGFNEAERDLRRMLERHAARQAQKP
ncbi:MAG: hypothetical protein H0X66_20360 [Verrucomicrobia bacterium]|nr:hypothetical protein [Verrucomicrobiota bacterium]